jgi:hypothetical protein
MRAQSEHFCAGKVHTFAAAKIGRDVHFLGPRLVLGRTRLSPYISGVLGAV